MSKRKKPPGPKPPVEAKPEQQREGNVAADRRYRAGVAKTIETTDVEELAKRALEALEGEQGDELREAEKRGRAGENSRT